MKKLILAILIILVAIILVSSIMVMRYFLQASESESDFSDLEQLIVRPTTILIPDATEDISGKREESKEYSHGVIENQEPINEPTEHTESPEASLAYEAYYTIYELNNDFVGWISIEGTKLNYPVMHTPKTPEYYLKRDFDKNYSDYGVPFLDSRCKLGECDNLIIYGHNMKNGSMFHALVNYQSESYYKEHPIVLFDTMDDFGEYQIIAAFSMDVKTEDFNFSQFVNMDQERFDYFISEIRSRSFYDTGVEVSYGDRLLTLSTCEYTHNNGRFVIVAKKIG